MGLYTVDRVAACLRACGDIRYLRKLHACVVINGYGGVIPLLLNRYVNIGTLSESRFVVKKIGKRDVYLWNAAIVGYFRGGEFEEVLRLYLGLKWRGIGVDSSTVTFGVKSCVEVGDVMWGRRIHADAFKVCFNGGKFVGSSLVGLYSRYGDVEDVNRAFDEILEKDVVAYTSMITGFARFSDSRALVAFEIVRSMMREGLGLNRVTLVSLLQAAGQFEGLKEGRSIHCYSLRRGSVLWDEVFETSLVDLYSRCGAATEAASLLTQSKRANVASWNALITGLVYQGQFCEALNFFSRMKREANVSPDSITIANVLTACANLNRDHDLRIIHGYLVRREIPRDLVVATILIDTYSKCDKIKYARKLFDRLIARDTILHNVMICGYVQNGKFDEAVEMFNRMVKEGVRPESATMTSLLSAIADSSEITKGRLIHGYVIRTGLLSDVNVSNQILYMYAKCENIDSARKIFNSIIEKDLVSWTSMMMGYIGMGHAEEALTLFQLMQGTMVRFDTVSLITVLQALSQVGCLKQVKEIHGYMHRMYLASNTDTNNTLISTYSKCGMLHLAQTVFNGMTERSLISWNTMIAAYGMHGYCKEVLEVFDQMKRENMKPDEVTFTSLFSACSHGGLVEEAWHIFCSMDSVYSISPQEEHYGCLVDLLGRAGQIAEAYEFLMCSPFRDSTNALCALLAACRVHGNTKLGEIIGRQLLNLEPTSSRNYTLVSSLYAQSGNWNESADLRTLAREKGLRNVPGFSLIEADMNH